jgi:uroporphyrinogen-III synthase
MESITILSTKKLKASVRRKAAQKEYTFLHDDFISIDYIENESVKQSLESLQEHLVFTSRHAVKGFQKNTDHYEYPLPAKKIFCLNGETLKAVHTIKNAEVVSVSGHADALAKEITRHPEIKSVTFICGNKRLDHLPNLLQQNSIKVNEIMVYRTLFSGKRIHDNYEAVFFFSPSGVESFFQTNILPRETPCFCIGDTTATSVREHTRNTVIVAKLCTQDSMLAAAQQYFLKRKDKLV